MNRSSKAESHNEREWNAQLNFIAQLYVGEGLSHEDIATRLAQRGFQTSGWSVRGKLASWKIQRYKPQDELRIMARYFLHCARQGQHVTFTRWGERFPSEKIEDYIKHNPELQASDDELPRYLQVAPSGSESLEEITELPRYGPDLPVPTNAFEIPLRSSSGGSTNGDNPRKRPRHVTQPLNLNTNESTNNQKRQSDEDDTAQTNRNTSRDNRGNEDSDAADDKQKVLKEAVTSLQTLVRQLDPKDERYNEAIKALEQLLDGAITEEKQKPDLAKEQTDLGPLHWAAFLNDRKSAEILLAHGADVNARGGLGWTPLHVAAMEGHSEILSFLLVQEGVDVDATADNGATALLYAAEQPSLDCALSLIRYGANVDIGNVNGMTTLHFACQEDGLDELIRVIVERTRKLDVQNNYGRTALHLAIISQNEDYVITLMEAGASLNITDKDGRTPMHQACFRGSVELLLQMVEQPVDLTVKGNEDETVLHLLCQRNLCEVARAAVEKPGVNIDARSRAGTTPLILAANSGHFDTVRMLVEKGADISVADEDMDTALTRAIRKKHADIVRFLVENKSPVNPQNQSIKKWKAKLEHNRKVQQALSLPTPRGTSAKIQREQPTAQPSGPIYIQVSPAQLQAMQNFQAQRVPFTNRQANVNTTQNEHLFGQRMGGGSNPYGSVPQFMMSNNSANSAAFSFNPSFNFGDLPNMDDPMNFQPGPDWENMAMNN